MLHQTFSHLSYGLPPKQCMVYYCRFIWGEKNWISQKKSEISNNIKFINSGVSLEQIFYLCIM